MAKKRKIGKPAGKSLSKKTAKSITQKNLTLAVVGLILNIILPGLGTLVSGKIKIGIWQVIISTIGIILTFYYIIGWSIMMIVLIWAFVTSIKTIQQNR